MGVDVAHSNVDTYEWVLDVLLESHVRQGRSSWPLYGRRSRELRPTAAAVAHAIERVRGLASLAEDWDSYGALPPSNEAMENARSLLANLVERLPGVHDPSPFAMSPLADGGIQLEWERPDLSLELEVNTDGTFGYLLVEGEGQGRQFTEKNDVTLEEVIGLIRRAVISSPPA